MVSMQVADAGGRALGQAAAIKVVVADVRSARPLVPIPQVDGFRAVHDADDPPALGVVGEGGVQRAAHARQAIRVVVGQRLGLPQPGHQRTQ